MKLHGPAFVPLDLESWPRAQTYRHFRANPYTFNVTAELDITHFRQRLTEEGQAFAPAIIYAIYSAVNRLPALRMAHVGGEARWAIGKKLCRFIPSFTLRPRRFLPFRANWAVV